MDITLINPNRYKFPPVIPIGLEYIARVLEDDGHSVEVLDLCFVEDIYKAIDYHFNMHNSDIVGVTIRNIDPSIFGSSECFLDEVSDIIKYIKSKYNKKIILGGAGYSIMPEDVLRYVDGDYGIYGYGERAIVKLINDINSNKVDYKIIDGYKLGSENKYKRNIYFNYDVYFNNGGIAGFETQKGCNGICNYCYESGKRVIYKDVCSIIEELRIIIDKGYKKFHLCDSEFNQNADFCEDFLRELIRAKIDMSWVLYMKVVPYTREMFALLKKSGVEVITLSVDSYQCTSFNGQYSFENIKDVIDYTKEFGIKLAVDLLTGFPYESGDSLRNVISFFKENRPNTVGVSYAIRIYPSDEIGRIVLKDESLMQYFSGNPKEGYIKPVYFKQLNLEEIVEIVGGDELFRIETGDKMVNYERL